MKMIHKKISELWRAMLDLFQNFAVKVPKPCLRFQCVTNSGSWQRLVRSSTLFPFTQNYNGWGLFLHFLPRNLRQLKRTFEPYVKDPAARCGITSTHLLFHKAQSFTCASRELLFLEFYELHVPRRRLTLDCVELSLVSWFHFKSVFKICIVIF